MDTNRVDKARRKWGNVILNHLNSGNSVCSNEKKKI